MRLCGTRSRAPLKSKGSRPISRVLSRTIIHLGPLSPAASSDLPGSPRGRRFRNPEGYPSRSTNTPLFGLAPGGVYLAAVCCHPRGALLPHHFTLTAGTRPEAVSFLLHFPWTRVPQALPGTLPAGARTFLPLNHRSGVPSDCLAGSSDHLRPVAGLDTGGQAPFSRVPRCSEAAARPRANQESRLEAAPTIALRP